MRSARRRSCRCAQRETSARRCAAAMSVLSVRSSAPLTLVKATAWPIASCSLRTTVAARLIGLRRRRSRSRPSAGRWARTGARSRSSAPPIDRFSVVHAHRAPARPHRSSRGGPTVTRNVSRRCAKLRALLRWARKRVPRSSTRARRRAARRRRSQLKVSRAGPAGSRGAVDVEHDGRAVGAEHDGDEVDGPATTLASWPTVGRKTLTSAMSARGRGSLSGLARGAPVMLHP